MGDTYKSNVARRNKSGPRPQTLLNGINSLKARIQRQDTIILELDERISNLEAVLARWPQAIKSSKLDRLLLKPGEEII